MCKTRLWNNFIAHSKNGTSWLYSNGYQVSTQRIDQRVTKW